jgi:pimeloyl-ACP methyl ester carboxylesterase
MKRTYIILILATLFLGACEKTEFQTAGDYFYLTNKGANMPIWVKGNFESDVIIITVHGGPGDSGMEQHLAKGFKYLEDDYLMVYWDQRNSGMSKGRTEEKSMHPDQFIDDTDKVVQLIQDKYPGKKLFMIGHSWGGQLSAGYLGRDNNYTNFKGWIDLDGSLYGDIEVQMMKDYILERVPAKMAEPDADQEFWQYIIDFYDENPVETIGNYTTLEPYWYASAVGGDVYDYDKFMEEVKTPYVELIFKSMFALSFYVDAFYGEETYGKWDDINYTPEIGNITIPALMLWGADDGIVPAELADYIYDNLGTDPSMKEVVKIPECGHGPQHEHPEIFYDEVSSFVETYKNL